MKLKIKIFLLNKVLTTGYGGGVLYMNGIIKTSRYNRIFVIGLTIR